HGAEFHARRAAGAVDARRAAAAGLYPAVAGAASMIAASRRYRSVALAVFALLVAGINACSDRLEAGASCPLLCPQEGVPLRDTVIDIVSDTTVVGFPSFGLEDYLLVASRGDTLETRAIIRYDTLFATFNTS